MDFNEAHQKLKPLCTFLEKALKSELASQGHIATGKLRDSIRVRVVQTATGLRLDGESEFYGKYVDRGRKPGGKRVPIQALVAWLRVKGIPLNGRKEIDMAFAIQHSIWKNGIPTDRNPGKKKFITNTLKGNKTRISTDIKKAVGDFVGIELHNIIEDVKQDLGSN